MQIEKNGKKGWRLDRKPLKYPNLFMEIIHEFFSKLHHLDDLIQWGGLTVLFLIVFAETGLLAGFFLPGDSLLVTAGLIASNPESGLDIWTMNIALMIAAITGDSTGYWIGATFGPKLFNRKNSFFFRKEYVDKTHAFYEKHGPKTIVLARFVPIIRTFAPTMAGVGRMKYTTFLAYNIGGGILWVSLMTLAGYFLGRSIPNIEEHLHWVILVVIILSLIPIAREVWIAREASKQRS